MSRSNPEIKKKGGSLVKTLGTAMLIAGLIAFAAMFFALQKKSPEGIDPLPYYLPWCLSYGIVNLLIAAYGVVGLLYVDEEKTGLMKASGIFGIIAGSLILLEGLPLAIFLSNGEFCVSLIVIGVCVGVIGYLVYPREKKEE